MRIPLLAAVATTLIGVAVSAILSGVEGALGAVAGGLMVIAFLGSTPMLLTPVVRASTVLSPVAALMFFTVKAAATVVLLALLFDVGGAADHVNRTALGLTAMAVSIVWTTAHVVAFRKDRTPTYDLGSDS